MDALNEYVKELRLSKGEGIPDFSTNDGRAEAKVLFLHRDPWQIRSIEDWRR